MNFKLFLIHFWPASDVYHRRALVVTDASVRPSVRMSGVNFQNDLNQKKVYRGNFWPIFQFLQKNRLFLAPWGALKFPSGLCHFMDHINMYIPQTIKQVYTDMSDTNVQSFNSSSLEGGTFRHSVNMCPCQIFTNMFIQSGISLERLKFNPLNSDINVQSFNSSSHWKVVHLDIGIFLQVGFYPQNTYRLVLSKYLTFYVILNIQYLTAYGQIPNRLQVKK